MNNQNPMDVLDRLVADLAAGQETLFANAEKRLKEIRDARISIAISEGKKFLPLDPQADSELNCQYRRIIVWFGHPPEVRVFVAEPGDMHAGWVVGILFGDYSTVANCEREVPGGDNASCIAFEKAKELVTDAAPELLTALKGCVEWMEFTIDQLATHDKGVRLNWGGPLYKARAAITKAVGGAL